MQLVIELPSREEQLAFNRRRWAEVAADPTLAALPYKIETNANGNILMMPPASGGHSYRQSRIQRALEDTLGGFALPECPVSTIDGVRAADVGWYSEERFSQVDGQIAFEIAPEICVEVISPCNTASEMNEKKKLYFEAGADEVWFCADGGSMQYFDRFDPNVPIPNSALCPDFVEIR